MGAITRIDAVNQMLLAAGESLVADLDEASGVDTGIAEFMLDRATEDFQMRGLTGNKYEKKMKPDSALKLMLPSDLLSAELVSDHTNDDGASIMSSLRGEPDAYLWNVTDQKDTWESGTEYTIEIIHKVRWEDMDTPVQRAVMSTAMRRYQLMMQGDSDMDSYLGTEEQVHNARGRASDINDRRRNIFATGDSALGRIFKRPLTGNDPSRFRFWTGKIGG
tara:strand:- start:2789 stop:3448 length:660 start_codon:yes stop_codon:yes gene_type:complete